MMQNPEIEVFYDGECPVCRWEIDFYARIDSNNAIQWVDINHISDPELPDGKSRLELLGRFHVRQLPVNSNDQWKIGVDAFAQIWKVLPFFRFIYWIFWIPGIRQLTQIAYLGFIRWQASQRAKRAKG